MNDRTIRCSECQRDKYRDPKWKPNMKGRCYPCLRSGANRTRRENRPTQASEAPAPVIMHATGYDGPPCCLCETPTNRGFCVSCGVFNAGRAA